MTPDRLMEIAIYMIHGFIGGLLYLLVHWKWDRKSVAQHTVLSALSGYIYFLLHQKYGFPDSLMAVVVGYFGADFVKTLMDKIYKKIAS